ncbi:Hemicentin-1 [Mactra antiquata]
MNKLRIFSDSIHCEDFTISVLEGEQAVLPCVLPTEVDNNITVTWSFWDEEISFGDNVTINDDRFELYRPYKNDWYLRITSVQLKDVGRYICSAGESFISVSTLVVEFSPRLSDYKGDELFVQICYNTRLTLYCNATGLPRPTITWYKIGDQLKPILSDLELYEQMIFIPEVDHTSSGVYLCKVKNKHGETSMKFHVTVIDRMTYVEPVQKLKVPRQIVHAPIVTNGVGISHFFRLDRSIVKILYFLAIISSLGY